MYTRRTLLQLNSWCMKLCAPLNYVCPDVRQLKHQHRVIIICRITNYDLDYIRRYAVMCSSAEQNWMSNVRPLNVRSTSCRAGIQCCRTTSMEQPTRNTMNRDTGTFQLSHTWDRVIFGSRDTSDCTRGSELMWTRCPPVDIETSYVDFLSVV